MRTSFVVAFFLTLWCAAGANLAVGEDLFDLKRSQREIEIMRGILRTSLSYAGQDLDAPFSRADWSSIDGFYLVGQGAVFIIPMPGPGDDSIFLVSAPPSSSEAFFGRALAPVPSPDEDYLVARAHMEAEAAMVAGEAEGAELDQHLLELEQLQELNAEDPELEDKIEMYKKMVKKRQQDLAKLEAERADRLARYRSQLEQVERQLIDALSGHGDSLSQVAPDEYVTLVLSPSSLAFGWAGEPRHQASQVISVKKATITAYKTGKLSADGFRKAVLQYTN